MHRTATRRTSALTWGGGFALAMLAAAVGATEVREKGTATRDADLPRGAASESQDLPAELPFLTLYLYDVHELLGPALEALAAETSSIFKDMGIQIVWRTGVLGTTYGGGPLREIPIIALRQPPGAHGARASVLGFVPKQQPGAVWVFVDNLRATLGLSATDERPASARRLGVALGRVIAHEVVHTLAPQFPHTRRGLMRDALDNLDLTGAARPAHDECREIVRAALKVVPSRVFSPTALALPLLPRY